MSEENKTLIYAELLSGIVGGYVTDYSQIKNAPTLDVIPVTTLKLYEMQISNGLIPNKSYLIYDHVTYIDNLIVPTGINRTSNLIPFDIIVTASSKNTLCEDAIIKSHDYNYESPFSDYCNMLGFSGRYNYDQYSIKGKLVESDFPVMYLFDNGQIFQYFKKLAITIDDRGFYGNIYVDYLFDSEAALYICIVNSEVYSSHDLLTWLKFPFVIIGAKNHYYDITYMKDDKGNQYTYDAINKLIVENVFIRATFYNYITDGTDVALFSNQYAKNNNIDKDVAIYTYNAHYNNNVIKNNFISVGQIQAQLLNIDECFEGIFKMETRELVNLYNISIHGHSLLTDDLYIPLVSNKQYYLNPETNTLTENNPNSIIEVTYDLLLEMSLNYKLTPEAEYLIIDYVTTLEEGVFETGHSSNADFPVRNDYLKMNILVKAKDSSSLYSEGKALPAKYKSNFGIDSIRESFDILYDVKNQNSNVIYGIVLDDLKVFYFYPSSGGYITSESELIIGKYTTDNTIVGTRITYTDAKGLRYEGIITDILTPKGVILWMKDMRGNEAPYDFISNSFYIDGLSTLRPGYYYTFTGTDGSNNYDSSLYQNIKIKQDFNLTHVHLHITPSIFTYDYGPQLNINVGYLSHVVAVGNLTNVNIYPDTYVLVENCTLNNVDILFSNEGTIAHVLEDYTNVLLQASPEGLIVQDKINIKKELPIIELLSTSSVIEIDNPANFLVGDRVTFKVKQSHRVDKVNKTSRGQYRFEATLEANSVNNGIILKPGLQTIFYIEIPMENPTKGLTVGTIFDTVVEIRNGQLYFVAIGTEFSSYSDVTTSTSGLMSSSDKTKLDTYPSTYTEVTSYTDTAIANLVDSAPETLNTLNELATAIQENGDVVEALNQSISSKQDTITDLETIRQGAAKGATALQSYTEQYKGTVTGVKINGTTKNPSSGVVDLGTVITSHQDISGKLDTLVSGTNIKTVNGQSLLGNGDLEILGLKTYTFDYINDEQTITQEELNKVLESDKIYIKHNDILVEVTVKKESDSLLFLNGYYNDLNSVCEYHVNINKSNLKYFIVKDFVTLLTESDLEGLENLTSAVNYTYVECPYIEDGLVLEEQEIVFDPNKIQILIVFVENLLKLFYLYSNTFSPYYMNVAFYGKYTDTSLLKATYSLNDWTLTFNIIEQSGGVSNTKTPIVRTTINNEDCYVSVDTKTYITCEGSANIFLNQYEDDGYVHSYEIVLLIGGSTYPISFSNDIKWIKPLTITENTRYNIIIEDNIATWVSIQN